MFYPADLTQKNELSFASRRLTAIEINATYYGSQKPESWRRWAAETPDGFVFTVKGSRFTTNRKVLAEAGELIARFFDQGLPNWATSWGRCCGNSPRPSGSTRPTSAPSWNCCQSVDGLTIRHCVEVRHDSFANPAFAALLRQFQVPVVFADHQTYPALADVTGDFVYARLQTGSDEVETAYREALDAWAGPPGRLGRGAQGFSRRLALIAALPDWSAGWFWHRGCRLRQRARPASRRSRGAGQPQSARAPDHRSGQPGPGADFAGRQLADAREGRAGQCAVLGDPALKTCFTHLLHGRHASKREQHEHPRRSRLHPMRAHPGAVQPVRARGSGR